MRDSAFPASWAPPLLSVMRAIVGFLFLQHGGQKLFNLPVAMPGPPPELFSLIGLAGVLELGGGLLLLVGLFTRWTAFILSGQMAFAYFMVHAGKGFWPLANQGELAVFYCFVFLYLAAAGGGSWSLDRLRIK
ncbi:DoxX family protein [Desulfuromonas carbonis]|uniref:DoxX family protein n=1 Tax=Desulfuromonas sp. DDH964 TaxID=1823759 RepID=UPI00078DA789|nr:DoxX family protein [Desulfuromonas sp. DDH964]AMV71263.1 DoxX family protein [Desulfuromonas sp. DDH964]